MQAKEWYLENKGRVREVRFRTKLARVAAALYASPALSPVNIKTQLRFLVGGLNIPIIRKLQKLEVEVIAHILTQAVVDKLFFKMTIVAMEENYKNVKIKLTALGLSMYINPLFRDEKN